MRVKYHFNPSAVDPQRLKPSKQNRISLVSIHIPTLEAENWTTFQYLPTMTSASSPLVSTLATVHITSTLSVSLTITRHAL